MIAPSSVLRSDTRAASSQISTILSLLIMVVLVSGVITTMGTFTENTYDDAVEKELTVTSELIGAQLMKTQSLVSIGETPEFSIRTNAPERISGSQYTVTLSDQPGTDAALIVETTSPGLTSTIPLKITVPIQPTTVSGGDIYIIYTDTSGLTLSEEPL